MSPGSSRQESMPEPLQLAALPVVADVAEVVAVVVRLKRAVATKVVVLDAVVRRVELAVRVEVAVGTLGVVHRAVAADIVANVPSGPVLVPVAVRVDDLAEVGVTVVVIVDAVVALERAELVRVREREASRVGLLALVVSEAVAVVVDPVVALDRVAAALADGDRRDRARHPALREAAEPDPRVPGRREVAAARPVLRGGAGDDDRHGLGRAVVRSLVDGASHDGIRRRGCRMRWPAEAVPASVAPDRPARGNAQERHRRLVPAGRWLGAGVAQARGRVLEARCPGETLARLDLRLVERGPQPRRIGLVAGPRARGRDEPRERRGADVVLGVRGGGRDAHEHEHGCEDRKLHARANLSRDRRPDGWTMVQAIRRTA